MKPAPTLIDTLYRLTFDRTPHFGWRSNAAMRERLVAARRFILDDSMSGFLADLSHAGFGKTRKDAASNVRRAEQLRVSARAPHKVVWFEYNLKIQLRRANDFLPPSLHVTNPDDAPDIEGWLIEQHPGIETAFRLHLFSHNTGPVERGQFHTWTFPCVYAWTTDATPVPWPAIDVPFTGTHYEASILRTPPEVFLGLKNYHSTHVGLVESELLRDPRTLMKPGGIEDICREWAGTMRRVWALLATIDDLPMKLGELRGAKGFVARGRYRKFLDHRTITLHVPDTADRHVVARNLIAKVRRKAHQVRGHWRDDWRNPPSRRCQHEWTAEQRCERCQGHRIWISEHQRGDASIGFVSHDYKVTHEERERKQS